MDGRVPWFDPPSEGFLGGMDTECILSSIPVRRYALRRHVPHHAEESAELRMSTGGTIRPIRDFP
jgi:hypothetical protein